jgi:hypothetical protein
MKMLLALTLAMLGLAQPARAENLEVTPDVGNGTLTATFDADLGERIIALSVSVGCKLSLEESGAVSGACSVPLTSFRVDNHATKTDHFQQWATNKKSDPKKCRFEAALSGVKLGGPLVPMQAVAFTGEAAFTICGRGPRDGRKEAVEGTAILFPPGSYGTAKTLRLRVKIGKFNRDTYGIGPKYTEGWLARAEDLAQVVAEAGVVELNLFAKASPEKEATEPKAAKEKKVN